jgi:hypothetical protein
MFRLENRDFDVSESDVKTLAARVFSNLAITAPKILLLGGTLLAVSCSKVTLPGMTQESSDRPTPQVATSAPVAPPHPATGAKEAAMKMYPDLAVKGSTFNKTFIDLYNETAQNYPDVLTRPEWPLTIAHRTAALLRVGPVSATPQPVAAVEPPPVPKASPTPGALDRGTHDYSRSRAPYSHWTRYYYPQGL